MKRRSGILYRDEPAFVAKGESLAAFDPIFRRWWESRPITVLQAPRVRHRCGFCGVCSKAAVYASEESVDEATGVTYLADWIGREPMASEQVGPAKPPRRFIQAPPTIDHSDHGRGDDESGPDDSDCLCRGTAQEAACAADGCGFCVASDKARRQR